MKPRAVTSVEAVSLAGEEVAVCSILADLIDEATEDGLLPALAVVEGPEVVSDHVGGNRTTAVAESGDALLGAGLEAAGGLLPYGSYLASN